MDAPERREPADDSAPDATRRDAGAARPFASRAGAKLEAALEAFAVDVAGRSAADFGCNVGGFTDCLLRRGARSVIAIDTGYGTLDWRLRENPRVVVRERTNALHAEPPEDRVDVVVVDMGWTKQRLAIPAALRWIGSEGRIVTLLKPHYEVETSERSRLVKGRLAPADAEAIRDRVLAAMPGLGAEVLGAIRSPVTGAKSSRRRRGGDGNVEYLALLRPAADLP